MVRFRTLMIRLERVTIWAESESVWSFSFAFWAGRGTCRPDISQLRNTEQNHLWITFHSYITVLNAMWQWHENGLVSRKVSQVQVIDLVVTRNWAWASDNSISTSWCLQTNCFSANMSLLKLDLWRLRSQRSKNMQWLSSSLFQYIISVDKCAAGWYLL